MRVLFRVNLGSVDAERCGVDFKQATVGSLLDCDESTGKWLVANGIATQVVVPKPPEPVVVQAVPQTELVADPVSESVVEATPVVVTPPVKPIQQNKPKRN